MEFIPEARSAELISHELAYDAIRDALIAAADPDSVVFPAVIAHGSDRANRFSVKAGATRATAGVKMGFNWPSNKALGMPSHNSIIVIFDQSVGRITAVIEAGVVNAYRTSAADAVAVDALARPDARCLTVFGAGNQAGYECLALARIRPIEEIRVVNRDAEEARIFVERLARHGLRATLAEAEEGCRAADIIVTATPSRAPLFEAAWVRPGAHVSTMGADSQGKQEAPVALLERASLFCDLPEQSTRIGELQHLAGPIAAGDKPLTAVGRVLAGTAPGRQSDEEITLFDSSGIALQDLYIGERILAAHHGR
ncbi:ornithine cyclodeaminase family protein [Bordetella genomosp. 10]|uniref:Ornithine cyclodeaminase family protein n=1 Tax=Bordetella genomosp. 10 TaxID=1416804 RepID=A0A261S9N9_9BORD|nr:ornithine cyclodeaminase family protein [Bordetella genomosp. 10]OZI34099.1 ornithine cyclodeaminase family protein [Bordetella genomosp. 10]